MPPSSPPHQPPPTSDRRHLYPAGGRWGEGADSALEELRHDRATRPDAWREQQPDPQAGTASGAPRQALTSTSNPP